jgi:hypothetical protein
MVWFYEHSGSFRRFEIYPEGTHYRLIVGYSDDSERVEEFDTYDALVRRTESLQYEWKRSGWKGPHGRDVR